MLGSRFVWWVSLPLILSLTGLCNARIINVPDDFETIQAGIDVAEDSDTVLVQPGIYFENINFGRESITLASHFLLENDEALIERTVIDGGNSGRVVTMDRLHNASLIGFTIRNGNCEDSGGGIYLEGIDVLISNVIVSENHSDNYGGGIYVTSVAWDIQIVNAIISSNSAFCGGGLSCYGPADVFLRDTKIINNIAEYYGAGIYAQLPEFYLENCVIKGNSSQSKGGAVGICYGTISISYSLIEGNNSEEEGGAFLGRHGELMLLNSIVINNTSPQNSLFSYNGRELYHVEIHNSIIWHDDENAYDGEGQIDFMIAYSDLTGEADLMRLLGADEEQGNIDADPLFADPENGDYHLTADSPCIDAGDPESNLDPDSTRADMGAFYFHQRDIEVDPDTLEFVGVQTGIIDTLSILIRNVGLTPLQIYSLMLDDEESPFEIISEVDTFSIEAESESIALITFSSEAQAEYRSMLRITSDDPDEDTVAVPLLGSALDVKDPFILHPSSFILYPVSPNPFNSTTTISYSLPNPANLSLVIYNIYGNPVATMFSGYVLAGQHSLSWNAVDLPSGVYVCRLEAGNVARQVKLVNIK